jgi:hypothetical protein
MKPFRLSRRAVLRGAGGVAIALPWLEVMGPARPARAAGAAAERFVVLYTPGGTVLDQWRPIGTETDFSLSPILSPFAPVRQRLLVLDGIDMPSAAGEQDQSGMIALLTGTAQAENQFAGGPSIDQVLARVLAAGSRRPSLELAVRWGTGKAKGRVSPMDIISYRDNATFDPVAPLLDPAAIWTELFGSAPEEQNWDKSILDAVGQRYQKLATRLGTDDRQRLDAHLTRIRELEQRLAAGSSGACSPPAFIDNPGYDPGAGLNSSDTGSVRDPETDAAIPAVGKLMMDMLVMALACDITPVGSLMWSDSEAKHTFPWLGLNETYRFYQNDGGFNATACATIQTWYQQQHAYLIARMAEIDMGGHTLLDESVVFIGSHIQGPADHSKQNMPFLLAGGGGLRTGRYLTYDHRPHNELLVALLNLFGDPRTSFGDLGSGALDQLT